MFDSIESFQIVVIDDKYKCCNCKYISESLEDLDKHLKFNCVPSIKYNNIYKFDPTTLAKNIFKNTENSGKIYIIQLEVNIDNIKKIGMTQNLQRRLIQYRTSNIYEPILHYYFPCKNIKLADKLIKQNLTNYNIKKEHYIGNIEEIKKIIVHSIRNMNDNVDYVFKPEIKMDISDCILCKKFFMTQIDLNNHLSKHSDEIKDKNSIDEEQIIKNDKKCIIDTKINYKTKNFSNSTLKLPYKCDKCNKIFKGKSYYIKHLNIKKQCDIKNNSEKYNMVIRQSFKKGVEYKCNKCNKIYKNKYDFNRHCNIRRDCSKRKIPNLIPSSEIYDFRCPSCNKLFGRKDNLKRHINKFCKPKNKTELNCTYCQKKFSRSDSLNRHLNERCKEKNKQDDEQLIIKQLFEEMKLKYEVINIKQNQLLNGMEIIKIKNSQLENEIKQLKYNL